MHLTKAASRVFIDGPARCVLTKGEGGHEFVLPRRLNMHVHQKPFLLRVLLATLEERRNVLVAKMAVQR
jgi:hypothetical protein